MMPAPSVLLAAAAQRTSNMRLGAAVSILPMHNPLRIAEEFAMVDLLSNGRVGKRAAAENVTAFHGFSSFKNVVIQSQGFDLEGTIKGTIRTHNYNSHRRCAGIDGRVPDCRQSG